jgi:serine/threonine protein kinase
MPNDPSARNEDGRTQPDTRGARRSGEPAPSLQPILQEALRDDWHVERLIGRGGFGEVYAVRDLRRDREVAIKVLDPAAGSSHTTPTRFKREAAILARLRHPHVVAVREVHERNGLLFFVMPLLVGTSVADLLDETPRLPITECQRITAEIANALSAVHELGVIHRDVKPANIFLEGEQRRAVLLDFGIAKRSSPEDESLTSTGLIVGSVPYMSPEQVAGSRRVGPASDQYSLALVMYRMLAGRLPFEGTTPEIVAFARLMNDAPPVTTWRTDVPAALVAVLQRALLREPDQRFPTVSDFGRAVTDADPASRLSSPRWFVALEAPYGDVDAPPIEVQRTIVVGRGPEVDIQLPGGERRASRAHCKIELRGDALLVVDLGGRNGTYLNGQRVDRAELRAGDRIQCGGATVRVSAG